jgi:hypothetical protein
VRIALRKSGGRGEYELAGKQGSIRVADLLERRLRFKLTPELTVDGRSTVRRTHGKTRIRRDDDAAHHAYLMLAAALLLPKPKRELRATTSSADFLHSDRYAVTAIDIDVASVSPEIVDFRPTTLSLGNAEGLSRSLDVARRMAVIQGIWNAARDAEEPLHNLVGAHEDAVALGDHRAMDTAAADLQKHLGSDGDILDALASGLGIDGADTAISPPAAETTPGDGVQDDTDPADAARRAVARWRRSVVRSASGRAFSARVRGAYANRCAVSGEVLPKLPHTASPGVDGAHVLPWARYDLNTVRNGICLSRLCHWAFDAGVIRIDFNERDRTYRVSIPDHVKAEAEAAGMTLGYFEALAGPIPRDRLPAAEKDWPSPKYLARLNAEMFGAVEP